MIETLSLAVRIQLEIATPDDAAALAELHVAADEKLTRSYGIGPWSRATSEKQVLSAMRNSTVLIARLQEKPAATLILSTKKPWAIDRKFFSPCRRPLYLTSMAVAPKYQWQGLGTQCIEAAKKFAQQWPADAIFLDAYDAAAGAGEFYRKCGFHEVGRATYRGAPLIYFEMLL